MPIPVESKILIHGTRKSAMLSNGEVFTVKIKPGEYRKDIQSIDDLISFINDNAYKNCDWVSKIIVGEVDQVRSILLEILKLHRMDENLALYDAMELGFLMHADHRDVLMLLRSAKS
jgi:hypothetical protein